MDQMLTYRIDYCPRCQSYRSVREEGGTAYDPIVRGTVEHTTRSCGTCGSWLSTTRRLINVQRQEFALPREVAP